VESASRPHWLRLRIDVALTARVARVCLVALLEVTPVKSAFTVRRTADTARIEVCWSAHDQFETQRRR
jgi:hypothetical protein